MAMLKIRSNVQDRLNVRVKEYKNLNFDEEFDVHVNTLQFENEVNSFPMDYALSPETDSIELYITKMNHDYMNDSLPISVDLPILNGRNYIIELHSSDKGYVCDISTHLENR